MGSPKEAQVWGDVRPVWDLVGGGGLGEATGERHPGGLNHDYDGGSTGRVNPDLGLKM